MTRVALVSLLCACALSCGTTHCDLQTCAGCCDGAGVCQAGTVLGECGARGERCLACPVGNRCSAHGACVIGGFGGLGSGGGAATGGGFGGGGTTQAACSTPGTTCVNVNPDAGMDLFECIDPMLGFPLSAPPCGSSQPCPAVWSCFVSMQGATQGQCLQNCGP